MYITVLLSTNHTAVVVVEHFPDIHFRHLRILLYIFFRWIAVTCLLANCLDSQEFSKLQIDYPSMAGVFSSDVSFELPKERGVFSPVGISESTDSSPLPSTLAAVDEAHFGLYAEIDRCISYK